MTLPEGSHHLGHYTWVKRGEGTGCRRATCGLDVTLWEMNRSEVTMTGKEMQKHITEEADEDTAGAVQRGEIKQRRTQRSHHMGAESSCAKAV